MTDYPLWWSRENLKPSPELWNDNTELHELPNMATESLTNGKARPGTVREWQPLGVLTGVASMPPSQTTGAGIDGGACGLAGKVVRL